MPLLAVWDCAALFRQSPTAFSCRIKLLIQGQTVVMSSITGVGRICTISTISSIIEEQREKGRFAHCPRSLPQSEDRMEGHKILCFAQRKSRKGAAKTVRMEQYIKTHRHSNTQARATLGSRPSNRATQAPDLGQVTVQRQQLISAK